MESAVRCTIDPTDALNASKDAFKLISEHLPPTVPKVVWRKMILAVQMVCEALEHKPVTESDYLNSKVETAELLRRVSAQNFEPEADV